MGFQFPQKMLAHITVLKASLQIKNPISSMQKKKINQNPISNYNFELDSILLHFHFQFKETLQKAQNTVRKNAIQSKPR